MEPGNQKYIRGTGEMVQLTTAYDWSDTVIGPMAAWPVSLRTQINLMLNSRFPMLIFWGQDLITFYNDAFRPSLGNDGKHPSSLGQKGEESWAESWSVIGPMIYNIMKGGDAVWFEDQKLPLYRNGAMGYAYWTYSFSPITDDDNKVAGVLVTCSETTDAVEGLQKLFEINIDLESSLEKNKIWQQQMETSENRFRTLIDKAPVATALFRGSDLIIDLANDVMIGYWQKGGDIIGKPYREAVPELEGQGYFEILDEIFKTGKEHHAYGAPADIEKNGILTTCYFNYSYTPLFDEEGNVYAILNMGNDVTESVLAEQRIIESQNELLASFVDAPVGIAIISRDDLVFRMVNSFYGELVGREPGELTGKTLHDALPELLGQGFDVLLHEVIATGTPLNLIEVPVSINRKGNLETIYVDLIYQPRKESNGFITGVLVIATDVTQQVLSRKRIEESESRFRALIEESAVATCLYLGRELQITIANDTILGYWGKGKEVIGKCLIDALPELVGQPFPELLTAVFDTGEIYEEKNARAEVIIEGKPKVFYFDVTYKPLRDESGEIYAVLDMAIDVTQQVLSRQELEKSEHFSRTIFYNSPIAKLVYTGEEMILSEANEKMLEIFGRDADIIGKPLMEAIPELKNSERLEKYKRVIRTGAIHTVVAERIELVKKGVPYWGYYDYTYKPLYDTSGKIYGVMCTAIEVTDQVLSRQRLEEAESNMRVAVELAQLGTWSIDVATNGLTYSDRLIEWFGYDPASKDFTEVIPIIAEEDRERVMQSVQEALTIGSAGMYDEIYTVIDRNNGNRRVIHAQGKTIFDAEGTPLRMNGTAQDITIQKQLQLALEQQVQFRTEEIATVVEELTATNEELADTNVQLSNSNEELAQFAYIASHDLQEPLRKISTFSQMLENSLGDTITEEVQRYLSRIMTSSSRMRKLVSDVLYYSQLVKVEEHFQKVDLNEILEHILVDFDLLIEQKGAVITQDVLPTVHAIPTQMMQLFRNILGNALKFTRTDISPVITVRLEELAEGDVKTHNLSSNLEYFKIRIQDNGIGIAPEYAQKIFNIFHRLHSKTEYEGTGIGLAMCKKIMLNHRGDIYVEGIPGVGSSFCIILPKPALT